MSNGANGNHRGIQAAVATGGKYNSEQRLAAQASLFKEGSSTISRAFIGRTNGVPSAVMIDINEYLLDGARNPFFLRPFMAGTLPEGQSRRHRQQLPDRRPAKVHPDGNLRILSRVCSARGPEDFRGYDRQRVDL